MQPEDQALSESAETSDLLERAKHGDREAVDALFTRHIPLLKRWASGRLPHWARDLADTGDLVQATALDAFRRLNQFKVRGDGALQAYLRQALMNRLRNELRRVSRKPIPGVLESGVADSAMSPLEATLQKEKLDRYSAALDRLTLEEREAVIGRIEFGLTYQELAEFLGKPSADAARMAVSRALVRLAGEMP
jgi:RNA polymerase sigma-70 factor (ECF subfamily)